MPKGFIGVQSQELLNKFIFKSTIRISILNRIIRKYDNTVSPTTVEYEDLCGAVLNHANDTRQVLQYIDSLRIEENEKTTLREYVKVLTLDAVIYIMGHVLIKMKGMQFASQINTCFVRKTRKFWVHLDNIETLYGMIIPYLPVSIFGDDGSGKIASYISSVYFDTDNFHLYDKRIRREQGAKSLRIRSYGESSIISYVELKTHEDGWTGERSTKKRFLVHTRLISKLSQGMDIWEEIESINSRTDEAFLLYKEVLNLINELSLKPVVKTVYTRTAFQFPEDSSIRISIDTKLAMWSGEVGKAFPYAILEVKLEEGNETEWILDLMNSPLVVPVDKFSKYLHGCSVHYNTVPSIPYWYNQISTPIKNCVTIQRTPVKNSQITEISEDISRIVEALDNAVLQNSPGPEVPISERECMSTQTSDSPGEIYNTNVNIVQTMKSEDDPGRSFFEPTALRRANSSAVPSTLSDKPVTVPVRVEPKVFFANERTFLSWLHFAIFIGGIGAALMGLGDVQAALSGLCFIVVSVIFSIYALYLYMWRAKKIKEKNAGPYDDHNGPIILVAVFLSAMITSVFFKFPLK